MICLALLWLICASRVSIISAQSSSFLAWNPVSLEPFMPSCRSLHSMVSHAVGGDNNSTCDVLLLYGGFIFPPNNNMGAGPLIYLAELWAFYGASREWASIESASSPPPAMGGHIAAPHSGGAFDMLLHGGTSGSTVFSDTWILSILENGCVPIISMDIRQRPHGVWTKLAVQSAQYPAARWGHMGALLNSTLIVFGGFTTPLNNVAEAILPTVVSDGDVWFGQIDAPSSSISWTRSHCGGNGPSPRAGMEFAKIDETRIIVISGVVQVGQNVDPATIDAETDVWLLAVSGTTCTWTLLTASNSAIDPSSSAIENPYPYPYVVFGSAVSLEPSVVVLYGGVIKPLTFTNNANLNALGNNYAIRFVIDYENSLFQWDLQSFAQDDFARNLFPTPRGTLGLGLATLGDLLMAFGGYSSYITACATSHTATDIRNNQAIGPIWSFVTPFFVPQNLYQADSIDLSANGHNVLLIVGGQLDSNVYSGSIPMWLFWQNENATSWQQYTSLQSLSNDTPPKLRWSHTLVEIAGKTSTILMFGGITSNGTYGQLVAVNELWMCQFSNNFNTYAWTRINLPVAPSPRYQHTAVMYGSWMVVYGGFPNNASAPALGDVWALDTSNITNMAWYQVDVTGGPLPSVRGAHIADALLKPACLDSYGHSGLGMMMFGGAPALSSSVTLGDLWALQVRWTGSSMKGAWYNCTPLAPTLPQARQASASVVFKKNLWLIMGGLDADGQGLGDSWVYTPVGWILLPTNTAGPRVYGHTIALSAGGHFPVLTVLGGMMEGEAVQADGSLPFVDYAIVLACPKGRYSEATTGVCTDCPLGSYSDQDGSTSCTPCPSNVLTNITGATSSDFCNTCSDDVACHGHGRCRVDVLLRVKCDCSGWYKYNDDNFCSTPIVAVIVGGVLVGLVLVAIAVWGIRKLKFVRVHFQSKELELHSLLLQRDTQVQEMKNAWKIDPRELYLGDIIGSGSAGDVYSGRWHEFQVAIKTVPGGLGDDGWADIDNEINLLRTIRHPNIVLFFGAGNFSDGMPFFVTELMDRGSLLKVLSEGPIDWPTKLRYVSEIAAGMMCLHDLRRVHRDLKSSNILVSRSNHLKVADFGTSAFMRQEQKKRRQSESRVERKRPAMSNSAVTVQSNTSVNSVGMSEFIGTLLWMAPEILSGSLYGTAVDVYSFGIVMWEIAAQELPWTELAMDQCYPQELLAILQSGRRPQASPNWPKAYRQLMSRCWDTEPNLRGSFDEIVTNMSEMCEAFQGDSEL